MSPAGVTDDVGDASFTFRRMEVDAAVFADAGFATADDFEPGHFDEPEAEELLAERIVAGLPNPFPADPQMDAASSTLADPVPPTHEEIEASLASLRDQLQVLALNDAARRLEIDEVRQAGQVTTSRLDDTELTIKDLQALQAHLTLDHNHTKTQLAQALTQLNDFMRYFSHAQQIAPASHARQSALEYYMNSPSSAMRHFSKETLTGIFSNTPSVHPPGPFDSASHAGPANRPLTRHMAAIAGASQPTGTQRTASNIFPQTQVTSGTRLAKIPRSASESPQKGKGKAKGKGKGKEKAKATGKGKGKLVEDDEDIIDDADDAEWEDE